MKKLTKITLITLISLISGSDSFGQQSKTDSLLKALKTAKQDTTKLNLLHSLAWQLKDSDPQKAFTYARQQLSLAKKLKNSSHKATAKAGSKAMANAYNTTGAIHWIQGDYPRALEYYLESLEIKKSLNDRKGMADSFNNIGVIYYNQGDYPRALEYYLKSLEIRKSLNDRKGMAGSYNNIGIIYYNQGDYPRALEYYLESLEIKKSLDDRKGMALSYNNIGIIYMEQGDYSRALEYYLKSLEIRKSLNNRNGMAGSYGNIGLIYYNQGNLSTDDSVSQVNYSRALEYHLKSLEITESLNDRRGMAASYNNIGGIYTIRQQYDSAFAVLRKALLIDEELGDKWTMALTLAGIGDNYIQQGKPLQALPWLERSAVIAEEIGAKPELMEAYELLSEMYEQLGKHPPAPLIRGDSLTRADCLAKALEYHKLYSTVRDSVFSEEKTKELGRQEGKFELKMHLAEQKRLKDEQERKEAAQIAYRDTWQNSGMLMGLVFLFVGVFFLGNFVIPDWVVKAASFIPFVLLFEFIFVLADPWIEALTGGQPLYILLINTGIVFMLFPGQYYFENKLRQRLEKVKKKKAGRRSGS